MSKKLTRVALLIVLDVMAINLSYFLALHFRFEFNFESDLYQYYADVYFGVFVFVTLIKIAIFYVFDLYNSLWKYASTTELVKIFFAVIFAAATVTTYFAMSHNMLPRSVIIISGIFDLILIGGARFSYRALRGLHNGSLTIFALRNVSVFDAAGKERRKAIKRVLVVGAGDAGSAIIKEIQGGEGHRHAVIVAVDDDRQKLSSKINGVTVEGAVIDICDLVEKHRIDEIIIAIPSADKSEINKIINECNKTKCKVKTLPGLSDLINEKVSMTKLRDVDILDLLGRDTVNLDTDNVSALLGGKVILVTGGAGSIGSELCRQIAKFEPRKIISLDVNENALYNQENEMSLIYPNLEFEVIISSIRNVESLKNAFSKFKPQIVFHAAAHKHVPLMEKTPIEAVLNNILGTKNVADVAETFGVERFVLISTDKAVNPTNVMGATKRAAEFIIQDKAGRSKELNDNKDALKTIFSAVRFGNVLDSNGSVIPTFRKQIELGGPVTVTHPDITRYFMTIPEAAQLVIQAGAIATGGEIFILDMGDPVKIIDLAKNMIELSGYKPYEDIDIKITGLRPGEKLYEEMLMAEEGIKTTESKKIFIGNPTKPNSAMLDILDQDNKDSIHELKRNLTKMTDKEVKDWLALIVPTYTVSHF